MKQYGSNKATEFSKKQISVIYGKAKGGELKVEKWIMSELYNLADYYGTDSNKSVERAEAKIMSILNAVFSNDLEDAQDMINEYTENTYSNLGANFKKNIDRTFVE